MSKHAYISAIVIIAAFLALPSASQAAKNPDGTTCQNGQGSGGYDEGRPDPCENTPDIPPVIPPPAKKLVFTANDRTIPKRLQGSTRKTPMGNWGCATVIARDNNGDGKVEYWYTWAIQGVGMGMSTATWNGERVVPSQPVPLLARLAVYGANHEDPYPTQDGHMDYDRTICALTTHSLKKKGMGQPGNLIAKSRVVYGTTAQRNQFPLSSTPYGVADHDKAAFAFQANYDRMLAESEAAVAAYWAAQAAAEQARWDANYAAWKATCAPGSQVPVRQGSQSVVWVC